MCIRDSVKGEQIQKECRKYKYLGTLLDEKDDYTEEIKSRIRRGGTSSAEWGKCCVAEILFWVLESDGRGVACSQRFLWFGSLDFKENLREVTKGVWNVGLQKDLEN